MTLTVHINFNHKILFPFQLSKNILTDFLTRCHFFMYLYYSHEGQSLPLEFFYVKCGVCVLPWFYGIVLISYFFTLCMLQFCCAFCVLFCKICAGKIMLCHVR